MAVLINNDRNILMMHIPRTGGSARDKALKPCGFRQVLGHARMCDLWKMQRIDYRTFDKIICVIRHPAER